MLRIRQKSDWLFFPWDLYASFDVFWLDLSNQPVGNTGWPEDISTNLAYFEVCGTQMTGPLEHEYESMRMTLLHIIGNRMVA
jgi:hypothetical protein